MMNRPAPSPARLVPAVFFDRDDTLIRCNDLPPAPPPAAPGDLVDPTLVELLPGARDACAALHAAGFTLVIVSNQGSVARGAATLDTVERVNARARELLAPFLTTFYFCPFHPKGQPGSMFTRSHPWQKPGAGMIRAACAELGIDAARSWLVGDAQRDIDAGIAGGLLSERCLRIGPDRLTLAQATERILGGQLRG